MIHLMQGSYVKEVPIAGRMPEEFYMTEIAPSQQEL